MANTNQSSRRDFLKGSTTAAAGLALAGGLSLNRSVHAAGSDVIKVALSGSGGRGTGAIGNLMNADKNVQLIAVADAFGNRAEGCVSNLKKKYGLS